MKKRNFFANKSNSSFLNMVKMITESAEDETEGLDFEDDVDGAEDDFADDEMADDEFGDEEAGDEVTLTLPRDVAQTLYDMLGEMLGGEEGADEFGDDEMADDGFGGEDEFGDDEMADDEFGGDEFEQDDEEEDAEDEDAEEEDECEKETEEEDEEVLGSNQSNVAQSTISRDGAPKRSKANTTWNTGKTVKSVFDQTVSHEGEPAGTSRDGAPKRSKFSKEPNRSKTVSSRLQPGKHIFEIGK